MPFSRQLTIDQHITNLDIHLNEFLPYNPIHIDIQGGQDSWSREENEEFIEKALQVQAKYPQLTASHEVILIITSFDRSLYEFLDTSNTCTLQSIHHCTSYQTFS